MADIIQFKTKSQKFLDWFQEVKEYNEFETKEVENAVMIWYEKPKDEKSKGKCMLARFNCEKDDLEYFEQVLHSAVTEVQMALFLRDHIHEFLEYI